LIEPEPYEVKVSRTVLRGRGRSNLPELPDDKNNNETVDNPFIDNDPSVNRTTN